MTAAIVDTPGVYDIEESRYHADNALTPELGRSLNVHGAMRLLDHSPLAYKWDRDHPDERKQSAAFDFGKAAHAMILGSGAEIVPVAADDWRTNAAKEIRDKAYADGHIPVLNKERDLLEQLRAAVLSHPIAGAIFAAGQPERSLYWRDDVEGVTCRARVDWVHAKALVDLKTTSDASDDGYSRSAANFGYYEQAEWYSRGWLAATGEALPFIHVVVENTPPFIVRVLRLDDPAALEWAARRNDAALRLYARCVSADEWPGPDADNGGMASLSLPRWVYRVKDYR
jgi:hypothetical protein